MYRCRHGDVFFACAYIYVCMCVCVYKPPSMVSDEDAARPLSVYLFLYLWI